MEYDNMKNTLLTIGLSFLLLQGANAQEVNFHIPYGTGGAGMSISTLAKDHLASKGYTVDLKALNSCAVAKQAWDDSKTKFVTLWEDAYQSDRNKPCNIAFDDSNFVKIVYQSFYYFCALPGKDKDAWKTAGKSYTVGHTQGLPVDKMFANIDKNTGSSAKLVSYRNSGALATAVAAKETDYVLTSSGTTKIIAEGGQCFWGTAPDKLSINNIPNVANLYKDNPVPDAGVSLWIMAKNMTPQEMDKLRKDITELMDTAAWKSYIESRELRNVKDLSIEEQKARMKRNQELLNQP